MSYQSFPWEQGDSVSPAKLIALDLPNSKAKVSLMSAAMPVSFAVLPTGRARKEL